MCEFLLVDVLGLSLQSWRFGTPGSDVFHLTPSLRYHHVQEINLYSFSLDKLVRQLNKSQPLKLSVDRSLENARDLPTAFSLCKALVAASRSAAWLPPERTLSCFSGEVWQTSGAASGLEGQSPPDLVVIARPAAGPAARDLCRVLAAPARYLAISISSARSALRDQMITGFQRLNVERAPRSGTLFAVPNLNWCGLCTTTRNHL
ncbi:hypothetical protein BKA93DRAFT_789043 [Sparassis latifolia]